VALQVATRFPFFATVCRSWLIGKQEWDWECFLDFYRGCEGTDARKFSAVGIMRTSG